MATVLPLVSFPRNHPRGRHWGHGNQLPLSSSFLIISVSSLLFFHFFSPWAGIIVKMVSGGPADRGLPVDRRIERWFGRSCRPSDGSADQRTPVGRKKRSLSHYCTVTRKLSPPPFLRVSLVCPFEIIQTSPALKPWLRTEIIHTTRIKTRGFYAFLPLEIWLLLFGPEFPTFHPERQRARGREGGDGS